jgi:hypothetical protein
MADKPNSGAAGAAGAATAEVAAVAAAVDPAGEALLVACKSNDLVALKAAFKDGAEPSYQDAKGTSGLMIAAGAGFAEVVDEMLLRGAPWNGCTYPLLFPFIRGLVLTAWGGGRS